jgi:hypothetical protein
MHAAEEPRLEASDGDGAPCSADCDDHDPTTYPAAPGCYVKDVNCDGTVDGIYHP